jgi:hypothetical protein
MKIKCNIRAGAYSDCDQQRNWWKEQAYLMQVYAKSSSHKPPSGLWIAGGSSTAYVPPKQTPAPSGGGWVAGNYYSDRSGYCG